jgi:hypothetical protein
MFSASPGCKFDPVGQRATVFGAGAYIAILFVIFTGDSTPLKQCILFRLLYITSYSPAVLALLRLFTQVLGERKCPVIGLYPKHIQPGAPSPPAVCAASMHTYACMHISV